MRIPSALLWLPIITASAASALSINFRRVRPVTAAHIDRRHTTLSDTGEHTLARRDGGSLSLDDVHDLLYLANVTVGGTAYPVQLDSGSSDLVIFADVPNAKTSGLTLNLTYGVGFAYGSISTATVKFADLTVPTQAVLVSSSFNNPVTTFGASGIMGLGFTTLSNIDATVGSNNSWGKSFLYNAFAQSPSEPNYITFSLIRSPNGTQTDDGGFTIGEVDPDFSAITSTPSISTWPVSNPTRWNILIDAYETSSGKATFSSAVKDVSNGQGVLLLDTGTSYVYAPTDLVTAMYKGVPGASFDASAGQWNVPCDQQVFLGFWIGGRRFDLHPLDLVVASLGDPTVCTGSFLPQSLAVGSGEFDILGGDVFLRNVFSYYDFGDFTDSTNLTMGDPYVKLLSTTNISTATLEFQKVRGGSTILHESPASAGNSGTSTTQSSPGSSSTAISLVDLKNKIDHLNNLEPIFFAVLGVNVAVMLAAVGLGVWYFCCRRRSKSDSAAPGRRPGKKFGRRGAPNTISTMELTTKGEAGESYAAVSLENPDGEPFSPPVLYDAAPGTRQSTVSFMTADPYGRHSRTLSGVSAFRPMIPTQNAPITTGGPEPSTPVTETGFNAAELVVPASPERARVSSTPNPPTDAYRRHSAMPPPGAMMAPPGERHRHSSFGEPTTTTPTRGTFPRQPSPLSSPMEEKSFDTAMPPSAGESQSNSQQQPQPQRQGSSGSTGSGSGGLSPDSFVRDAPSQRHSAMPGVMPFPSADQSAGGSAPHRYSAMPAGSRGAPVPNPSGFAPLTRQVSPLAGQGQTYAEPEQDTNATPVLPVPQINVSSDDLSGSGNVNAPPTFPPSAGTNYRHSARPPPRGPSMNNDAEAYRRSAAM